MVNTYGVYGIGSYGYARYGTVEQEDSITINDSSTSTYYLTEQEVLNLLDTYEPRLVYVQKTILESLNITLGSLLNFWSLNQPETATLDVDDYSAIISVDENQLETAVITTDDYSVTISLNDYNATIIVENYSGIIDNNDYTI